MNNSEFIDQDVSEKNTCSFGAFVNGVENLAAVQALIGQKLAVVLWYVHWFSPFPKKEADQVFANGSIPLITWEPWTLHPLGTNTAIAAGEFSSYVKEFLKAARDWGKPILLRFAHEMNGNWYPWDGVHNGGKAGPAAYQNAWRYIYNVVRELKADNIQLVWCVNHESLPNEDWNAFAAYFPGDQYVDWIGMDGYNWGYEKAASFDAVFAKIYQQLVSISKKPLMIGEFAGAEDNHRKADWITDAFTALKARYPRVKLVCWFNMNKERGWRIDSSAESLAAFRQAMADSCLHQSLWCGAGFCGIFKEDV